MVAGSGIEPLTSGLWVPRSNQLSYPAIKFISIYNGFNFLCNQVFKFNQKNFKILFDKRIKDSFSDFLE